MQQLRHAVVKCDICQAPAVWVDGERFAYCRQHQPVAPRFCEHCGKELPVNSPINRRYCNQQCVHNARREARRITEPA